MVTRDGFLEVLHEKKNKKTKMITCNVRRMTYISSSRNEKSLAYFGITIIFQLSC